MGHYKSEMLTDAECAEALRRERGIKNILRNNYTRQLAVDDAWSCGKCGALVIGTEGVKLHQNWHHFQATRYV